MFIIFMICKIAAVVFIFTRNLVITIAIIYTLSKRTEILIHTCSVLLF